jgi:glycosyltransferase involved in cell wall biosynthesis
MRLLIATQAADAHDPALSFFLPWITSLAPHFDHIHVICLKQGEHPLPSNVTVHSLGKEEGQSRVKYVFRFYRYLFSLRKEYDAVFVHMNSEYMALGGIFWRLMGKRTVLWRNHVLRGFSTWLGAHIAHTVLYTSPSSYTARFKNGVRMPIGIDTNRFMPAASVEKNSILFLGRLDEIKHPDVFVKALELLKERGVSFKADIVGEPTDPASGYAHMVRNRAATLALEGDLAMHPAVSNTETPALYASHAIYVNLTPSGSFDKTIGEAASSGAIVVAANNVVRDLIPKEMLVNPVVPESVATGIEYALKMKPAERAALSAKLREWVIREHSLALLTERLVALLQK